MFILIRVWSDSTEVGDRMAAGDQAHVAESDDDDDGDGGGDHPVGPIRSGIPDLVRIRT